VASSSSIADIGNAAGGAVSDIFGAVGDFAEAGAYTTAAQYATQNAQITQQSTAIQEYQAGQKIVQATGAEQAATAGAGLSSGGTNLDLMRASVQQGSLTKNLISLQGKVNENGYLAEAASYTGMASAANSAGKGGVAGGLIKGVVAAVEIAAMFI